ncbi:MAG: hypothetical protein ACOYK3_00210 [Flavobacterium sp.]
MASQISGAGRLMQNNPRATGAGIMGIGLGYGAARARSSGGQNYPMY